MSINTKQICKHKNIHKGGFQISSLVLRLDKDGYTLPSAIECPDCKKMIEYETYSKIPMGGDNVD